VQELEIIRVRSSNLHIMGAGTDLLEEGRDREEGKKADMHRAGHELFPSSSEQLIRDEEYYSYIRSIVSYV